MSTFPGLSAPAGPRSKRPPARVRMLGEHFVIEGDLDLIRPQLRLIDRLNDDGLPVTLSNALIPPASEFLVGPSLIEVNRAAVALVVPLGEPPAPEAPDLGRVEHVRKAKFKARLVVADTLIEGILHVPPAITVDVLVNPLVRPSERFVACTQARLRGGRDLDSLDFVLIGRQHIHLLEHEG